jgi:hypothetical protein
VANWPNARPHYSKGAEWKSDRPDNSVAEIGTIFFPRKGGKRAEFWNSFDSLLFPYEWIKKLEFSQILTLKLLKIGLNLIKRENYMWFFAQEAIFSFSSAEYFG